VSSFLVLFSDGDEFYLSAESFQEENNLTVFYDDEGKLVGGVVTSKIDYIERLPVKKA
jgi:hypothetical protein